MVPNGPLESERIEYEGTRGSPTPVGAEPMHSEEAIESVGRSVLQQDKPLCLVKTLNLQL
jgi:hypothetical protein